jgi:hypothetical protein
VRGRNPSKYFFPSFFLALDLYTKKNNPLKIQKNIDLPENQVDFPEYVYKSRVLEKSSENHVSILKSFIIKKELKNYVFLYTGTLEHDERRPLTGFNESMYLQMSRSWVTLVYRTWVCVGALTGLGL